MLSALLLALPLQLLAIRDVTIIDGPASATRVHHTVVIRDGRIAAVGPATTTRVPSNATVLDGRGKYLLPGFIDTHAHVAFGPVDYKIAQGTPQMSLRYDHAMSLETLRTLLAFGVTTVRNPAGPTEHAVAIRDSLERGQLVGPRVRTAGEAIEVFASPGISRASTTPDAVRAEVNRQADLGVDYVKLYAGLSAPLVKAGIEAAHARGIKAITHTMFTSWTDAAAAGIDGIVHVVPGSPLLIAPDKRADYLQTMRGTQFMALWFKFADLQSAELRAMVDTLVRRGTWLDLTLITFHNMFNGNRAEVREHADLQYAAPVIVDSWRSFDLSAGWTPADYDAAQAQWPRIEAFVRHLHRSGVRLTVGTDANNPWTPPGTSFHDELSLLSRAGIPNADILRMATLNGAESLGLAREIGTVDVGKRADLVLLGADPLAAITNTRSIEYVLQGGIARTPDELLSARLRRVDPRVR